MEEVYSGDTGEPSDRPGEGVSEPSWASYWAFARVRLGLSKREFFRLTLRQLIELYDEKLKEDKIWQVGLAVLRRDLINSSFGAPKDPVTLEQLLPGESGAAAAETVRKTPKLTKRRRSEIADSIRHFLGAEVVAQNIHGGPLDR